MLAKHRNGMEWNEMKPGHSQYSMCFFHGICHHVFDDTFFVNRIDAIYLMQDYTSASYILNGNEWYKPNKYWIGAVHTEYTPTNRPTNQHTKYMHRIRNFSLVIADPGVNFRWISFIIVLSVKWIQFFWNRLVYYLFGMMQRIRNQRLFCSSSFFFRWSNQI